MGPHLVQGAVGRNTDEKLGALGLDHRLWDIEQDADLSSLLSKSGGTAQAHVFKLLGETTDQSS